MNEWFQSPAYWYVLGFMGQMIFGSRFLVQWWVSERSRKVVIPTAFWYLSLAGGLALLVYAWHKRDPVFAIGQASGVLIYARNLRLLRKERKAAARAASRNEPA
jgi:lipid-A-disaccharide synthase-like uncharacterized protein